jgi:hypothetical protein
MRLWHRSSMAILPLVLLGLTAGLLSCAPVESGPRVWIDFPLEGSQFFPETTVSVTCHAFAREGVAEVQLAVNGEPYRVVAPAQPGEQFVEISMEWLAAESGDYVLSVTAFDVSGAAANPDSVTVTVVGETPRLVISPTAIGTGVPRTGTPLPPVETPPPATATVVAPTSTVPPTGSPAPPTATPRPPTATPPPPTIVSFEASPPSVSAGECTTLGWAVEGAVSAVWLDGDGVGDHDSRQRCPDATTTYTLLAEGPGGEDTATVRVKVTAPPSPTPTADTQGPAAPGGMTPTGGEKQGCGTVSLRWNPVSDPSGINTYYVKVEKASGTYKSGAWTTTETELTIPAAWLECGHQYRWAVRAEDGVGNVGPWSAWAEFAVTIG